MFQDCSVETEEAELRAGKERIGNEPAWEATLTASIMSVCYALDKKPLQR